MHRRGRPNTSGAGPTTTIVGVSSEVFAMADPTIVLIHGLWMTPRSWEHVQARYEERGHTVLAPSWPGLEGEVEAVRADPSPLASLTITSAVDHYASIVRGLDAPPVIMGHSFGGLFMQLLVDRGL